MLKVKNTLSSKTATRNHLKLNHVYLDLHGNIVLKVEGQFVVKLSEGLLWDIFDLYEGCDEFIEVEAELTIS